MTPIRRDPPGRITRGDLIAGITVALILIPQGMAYAELAGLPSHHGLYASALPLIAAAFLASSPYLQTGPVALTALLTLGALVPLAEAGTGEYAAMAALLAIVVGVVRMAIGMLRAGWLIYLISHSMMTGFLSAAAILILSSQLPGALGVTDLTGDVLPRAVWALGHPDSWEIAAVCLSAMTVLVVVVGRRIHPLVPGVLIAAGAGWTYSLMSGYSGAVVGEIPPGLPPYSFNLPWSRLPELVVPGIVIAVVGFAEGSSIARLLASQHRQRWDADKEFLSKGLANIVAGLTSGLPVGGSLSRTNLNQMAGAESKWSGLVTGVAVLLFLPFASVLGPLPRAVLSGIVISAIWGLLRPKELLGLWRFSRPQALVGWGTFVMTLLLEPHIDQAVLLGVVMALAIHMLMELRPGVTARREGDTLYVEPTGVLWFGSAPAMEDQILARLAEEPDVSELVLRCGGLGRIDLTGAHTILEMLEQAEKSDLVMRLEGVPPHAERVLRAVGALDSGPLETPVESPPGTGSTSDS